MPDAPFREPTPRWFAARRSSCRSRAFCRGLRAALPKAGDTVPGCAARRVRRSCRRARTRPQVGELPAGRCARAWDYVD